jgi:hypothetical protein
LPPKVKGVGLAGVKPVSQPWQRCTGAKHPLGLRRLFTQGGVIMNRRLKEIASCVVWVAAFSACTFFAPTLNAAPPPYIKLTYDLNKHLLLVTIIHDTIQDRSNFVKFVEIKKNGTVVSIHTYNTQPEGKVFTYQYKINAIEEDTLQAVVTFNKSGIRTSDVLIVGP